MKRAASVSSTSETWPVKETVMSLMLHQQIIWYIHPWFPWLSCLQQWRAVCLKDREQKSDRSHDQTCHTHDHHNKTFLCYGPVSREIIRHWFRFAHSGAQGSVLYVTVKKRALLRPHPPNSHTHPLPTGSSWSSRHIAEAVVQRPHTLHHACTSLWSL